MSSAAHRARTDTRRRGTHPSMRLTATTHLELADARRSRDTLLATARGVVDTHATEATSPPDPDAGRPDDLHLDRDVTALARRLADLAPATSPAPAASPTPAETTPRTPVTARATFLEALAAAPGSVRACRQTLHPVGHCWFTDVPGADGCGEVLRLAHRLDR